MILYFIVSHRWCNMQLDYVGTYVLQWDVLMSDFNGDAWCHVQDVQYNALAVSAADNVASWTTYWTNSEFQTSSFTGYKWDTSVHIIARSLEKLRWDQSSLRHSPARIVLASDVINFDSWRETNQNRAMAKPWQSNHIYWLIFLRTNICTVWLPLVLLLPSRLYIKEPSHFL